MLEDGQYGIEFQHERGKWQMPGHKKDGRAIPGPEVNRRVVCRIFRITGRNAKGWPETEVLVEETTYCSPVDNYDKETGRQVALWRALHKLDRQEWNRILPIYTHRDGAKAWRLDKTGHVKLQTKPAARREAGIAPRQV
jgi:hypothetical protein